MNDFSSVPSLDWEEEKTGFEKKKKKNDTYFKDKINCSKSPKYQD